MPKTRSVYGKVALKPKRDSNNLQTDDDDSFRSKGRTQDARNVKKSMKRGYEPSTESVSSSSSMLQAVHASIVKPRKSHSNDKGKDNANQNSRRRKRALRDSTNIKKKSIGDEITPKISNRNKGSDRQHPAEDVETLLQPDVFSPTIHSDGRMIQ